MTILKAQNITIKIYDSKTANQYGDKSKKKFFKIKKYFWEKCQKGKKIILNGKYFESAIEITFYKY